jgi:protein-ribulosamine 3-kinase
MSHLSNSLESLFKEKLACPHKIEFSSISGGSINETCRINGEGQEWFCKINSATKFPQLFEKESKGLKLLSTCRQIRVPDLIDCFEEGGKQVLILEWIREGERTENFWKQFGKSLAALHCIREDQFGLAFDNYMGSVPQNNQRSPNWVDFFIHQRLLPLVNHCVDSKLLSVKHRNNFEVLFRKLPSIFNGEEKPSLLHGDLWSGNFMCDENSKPVLIDPAVYFGHPSVDLGMTTLFGGFHPYFYEAYQYHHALPSNYQQQWQVSNLYPLLIHLHLFGQSYLPQINETLKQFV